MLLIFVAFLFSSPSFFSPIFQYFNFLCGFSSFSLAYAIDFPPPSLSSSGILLSILSQYINFNAMERERGRQREREKPVGQQFQFHGEKSSCRIVATYLKERIASGLDFSC